MIYPLKLNGNRLIIDQLEELSSKQGALSFSQFMSISLHHEQGYYRKVPTILSGKNKDYATCVTLSPLLGSSIAHWISSLHITRDPKGEFPIIEPGAGSGAMAAMILETLAEMGWKNVCYCIVELNPALVQEQKSRLEPFQNVHWCSTMAEAIKHCQGKTTIVCNEFADTFPVRVMQWDDNSWLELFLEISEGCVRETLKQPDPPIRSHDWLNSLTMRPARQNQRIELHAAFMDWWSSWDHLVHQAHWLIIDYGDLFPLLYQRKPKGTVRAYFQGTLQTDSEVYQRLGHQDITADVNFSELMHFAGELGWTWQKFLDQQTFINKFRPGETLWQKFVAPREPSTCDTFVLDPKGAGSHFKVALLQKK